MIPGQAPARVPGGVATDLASFVSDYPAGSLPANVVRQAELHILDTVGCGVAATSLGEGTHASVVATDQGGNPEASVFGQSMALPAPLAALANGVRCHALDFDDTHERGICHSSTVVGPAAFAVGEALGRSGRDVLDAYALGSEIALRIASAAAEGLYARGFHPTSVCGCLGAAAAAARLLGLDSAATTNALGIAGSFASGLLEYLSDGSTTKPLHAGWAAQAGILAARLSATGATGPASVLDGRFGVLAAYADSTGDTDAITDALGGDWELMRLSIKPFPACHFAHASTWAAGELVDEHGIDHDSIDGIFVRIPEEGMPLVLDPLPAKLEPRTPYDAKFSLPFTIGHRLVRGHLDVTAFSAQSIRDPEILAVASRVRPEPLIDPAPSRFAGGIRFRTRDGREFERFVPHPPGSPENPLDEPWVLAKFRANAALGLDAERTNALLEALRKLGSQPALDDVGRLIRACSQRDSAAR